MTQQARAPRLTGAHVVLIVVALCAAAVLTPVSVQAAGIARYRLVDANSSRAVEVSGTGRLQSDVRGSVRVTGGQVATRWAAPATAFSTVLSDNRTMQEVTGSSRPVHITSLTIVNLSLSSTLFLYLVKYLPDCANPAAWFFHTRVPGGQTFTASFPTPLVVNQSCARFNLPDSSTANITITGYLA